MRVDRRITSALNTAGAFDGRVNNNANIGKTSQEIAALWNEEHPGDPVVLEPQEPPLLVSPGLQMPS